MLWQLAVLVSPTTSIQELSRINRASHRLRHVRTQHRARLDRQSNTGGATKPRSKPPNGPLMPNGQPAGQVRHPDGFRGDSAAPTLAMSKQPNGLLDLPLPAPVAYFAPALLKNGIVWPDAAMIQNIVDGRGNVPPATLKTRADLDEWADAYQAEKVSHLVMSWHHVLISPLLIL